MTDVIEVAEPNTEVVPVETPEETTPPTDATAAPESETKEPEAKPEKTFTQKELDEILTRRLAKEQRKIERYARAEAERDQLREQLNRQSQPQSPSPSGEPKPEQFKTYEEYIDKLTEYKVERKLAGIAEKSEQTRREQAQQEYESRVRDSLTKTADKYDDFEEVVTNPSLPITHVMRDALGESEIGGEIAYYLGRNPKEAAEIAKLSNVAQVKAIDRLEAKLKAPPQVTKAPEPAETVGKGRTKTEPDLSKMSVSEYAEYRRKNGARWAR